MPWIDEDGDGFHDSTGESPSEYARRASSEPTAAPPRSESEIRSDAEGNYAGGSRTWADADGDGYHDRSGESRRVYDIRRQAESDRDAREEDAYIDGGGRTRDLDSGRDPRVDPSNRTMHARDGGSGGSGGGGSSVSDFDRDSADIPIWGWLSGAAGRRDAANAADAEARNRGIWSDLANYAPTANDLAVDYGQEGHVAGPKQVHMAGATGDAAAMEAERRALSGFEDIYRNGGMTAGDRARMQQGEAEMGRAMRSQRDADMASLRARGMGGSGAAVASMMGAQQGGADMLASREQQMQIAAQDRAMQALGAAGQMSGRMRASGWEEDTTRRGALDDFNRWNTDYERGREGRNQAWRGKTGESRSQARQQAYSNREQQAAGMTNQYATDTSRRQNEGQRDDDRNAGIMGALGEILDL